MRVVVIVGSLVAGCVLAGCGSGQDVVPVASDAPSPPPSATTPISAPTTRPTTVPPTTVPPTAVPPTTERPSVDVPAGIDGPWRAVSGTVGGVPVDLVGEITLTIDGTRFSGVAACNSYEYTAEIDGDIVTFVEGFVTGMGCDGGVMELEAAYLGSIGPTATVVLDGAALVLATPTATWVFDAVPSPAPLPFVGTRWVLSEHVGDFGVSTTVGMERGYVVFSDDGGVTGSTGCRTFAGTWVDRDGLVSADVTPVGECSGLLVDVDETLLSTLAAGFIPHIDANHLVVAVDGAGVGFFAG